jgi:hypothetical protein
MEQRSLRLGDIVDDYCPRERRITNHVVVAMVGDAVKQTRCTTCESEHVYKEARMPRKRVKGNGDDPAGSLAGGHLVQPGAPKGSAPDADLEPAESDIAEVERRDPASDTAPSAVSAAPDDREDLRGNEEASEGDEPPVDGWLAHRPLIRATLPRTEGEPPPARAIPEFTMHQRQSRGGRGFRQHQGWRGNGGNHSRGGGEPDGNRAPGQGGGKPGRHRGGRHRRRR